ncbi:MAG: TrkA family potassium uptake protein [Ruthenibacterium sp.]
MRVCIVGGGKLGYYLAKTLREHGHVPVLVEENETTCAQIADSLEMTVIHGDGTKPEVLESVQLEECQALVAVTGRDENNLVACQLAKQVFHVKKTVARVNNPKNASVLKMLGVDIAVSSTDNIARLIEREVETAAIRQLLSLAGGTTALTEISVPEKFIYSGQTLAQLTIPEDVVVISVTRGDEFIIPRGSTQICIGDKVLVLAKNDAFPVLAKAWKLRDLSK